MIKRITLKNLLSFENVAVELNPLTTLIGSNAVGKTNFMRSLEVVAALITGKLQWPDAILRVLFQSAVDEAIGIRLSVDTPGARSGYDGYSYTFAFGKRDNVYQVFNETLIGLHPSGEGVTLISTDDDGNAIVNGSAVNARARRRTRQIPAVALYGDRPEILPLLQAISPIGRYQLDPAQMRTPALVESKVTLSRTGSNLAAVLDSISEDPASMLKIENDLREAFPEIERLVLRSPRPGYKSIEIVEHSFKTGFKSKFVSDGVLLYLGMLVIASQPRGPRIACIKEPERGLHPLQIGRVMGALERLVDRATPGAGPQLVISSHSPIVLQHFRDRPELVRYISRDDGRSDIVSMEVHMSRSGVNYDDALQTLWTTGGIGRSDDATQFDLPGQAGSAENARGAEAG